MKMAESFFDEQADQSKIKTAIVSKYFVAWAQVITGYLKNKNDQRIAYIDLFAGPGRYKTGAKSTPVYILEQALELPMLRNNLVTLFNDRDADNTSSLRRAIDGIANIKQLKHKPQIATEVVGEN